MSNATLLREHHESGLGDRALAQTLWPFLRPYKKELLTAIGLLPLMGGTLMLQPFIIQWAIDGPIRTGDWLGLLWYSGAFLAALLAHLLFRYAQLTISQQTGAKIIQDIRQGLYDHLQTLSPRFFHNTPTGKLVTRLTSDVENLSEMLSSGGITIISDGVIVIGTLIAAYFMHWQLALLLTLMTPIMLVILEFFRRRSRSAYDEIRVRLADMNTFVQESLGAMDVVQAFGQESRSMDKFREFNKIHLDASHRSVFYDCSFTSSVDFIIHLTMIGLIALGVWTLSIQSSNGWEWVLPVTGGEMAAFFLFIQQLFNPIEEMSEKYTVIQSGLSSVDKIVALLQVKSDLTPSHTETAQTLPTPVRGAIEFQDISFGYIPETPVLKNVSLTVKAGQTIAIVGPSGAGKSTLVKLLCRFYDVDQGTITLDGQPIQTLDLQELRQNILTIQQDDVLFSRSIAENITLSLDPPNPTRLANAIKAANLTATLNRLSNGADTLLQERGKNLSGGEKQLILFARGFYHNPPVLILDEATSAIDPQTERQVQEALNKLMEGRTVLVIAHRLSTIVSSDHIVVIQGGDIAEQGTHEELLQLNGAYARFYAYQHYQEQALLES